MANRTRPAVYPDGSVSPREAASRLGIAEATVLLRIRQGRLLARKDGPKITKIDPEELARYEASLAQPQLKPQPVKARARSGR